MNIITACSWGVNLADEAQVVVDDLGERRRNAGLGDRDELRGVEILQHCGDF